MSQGAQRKYNKHLYRLLGSLWSWWSNLLVLWDTNKVIVGRGAVLPARRTEHLDPRSRDKRSTLQRRLEAKGVEWHTP